MFSSRANEVAKVENSLDKISFSSKKVTQQFEAFSGTFRKKCIPGRGSYAERINGKFMKSKSL